MTKRILLPLVFLVMKIRKNIQYMYQKILRRKHVDLLLIGEGKRHYFFIKDFSTFKKSVEVLWLSLLQNIIQLILNSGSVQVQVLLAAYWRFMMTVSDNC